MTIESMKARKRELGLSNQELSRLSGVPVATLQKLFSGKTRSPRRDTVLALVRILDEAAIHEEAQAAGSDPAQLPQDSLRYTTSGAASPLLRETAPVYQAHRIYTLRDYLSLPQERRCELINGVFYDMASPTTAHQMITSLIGKAFLDHVLANGGTCLPFTSPVDVVLDQDDRTVVQPDALIVCDRNRLRDGRVYGAPDLVVEVLSPSTRKKDIGLKLYKYFEAGVREYWVVDPPERQVVVFDMEHDGKISLYGEKSDSMQVPVSIWGGQCVIDFRQIFDFAGPLMDS